MKKFLNLFLALTLCAGIFSFTSCDEVAEELSGPEYTWCEIPVSLPASTEEGSDASSEPVLYLNVIYCPQEVKGSTGSSNLKSSITLPAGITILAHSSVSIESLGMTANSYTYKSFPIEAEENEEDSNDSYSFAGTKTKFTAIYWAKKELRDVNTQIALPKAPAALTNSGNSYTDLTDLSKFSWKQILANYLLNNL